MNFLYYKIQFLLLAYLINQSRENKMEDNQDIDVNELQVNIDESKFNEEFND